jgi:hypothetical protein
LLRNKIETQTTFFNVSFKMEKYYAKTRIRTVNGWLEVERSHQNLDTKCLTHIKMDRISHLTREGPFGDYDHNDDPIHVWHVNVHTIRPSGGKWVKHTIEFAFTNESEAETFLISINDKMY